MVAKKKVLLVVLLSLPIVGLLVAARDAASWRLQFVGVPKTQVYQFEISPTGRFAAIQGNEIMLHELATGVQTVLSHKSLGVYGEVCFSQDGHYLAWSEWRHLFPKNLKTYYRPREDVLVVWDTIKERTVRTVPVSLTYESALSTRIAFNADNVLMFHRDSKLLPIPADGSAIIEKRLRLPIFEQGLRLSRDGSQLVGVDKLNPSLIRIFDASTLKSQGSIVTAKPDKPGDRITKLAGQNLYITSAENVYSSTSSGPLWKFKTTVWHYSPDGRTLILFDKDYFQLRDSKTGSILRAPTALGVPGPFYTFAFEPDESHVIFYQEDQDPISGRYTTGHFVRQRIR